MAIVRANAGMLPFLLREFDRSLLNCPKITPHSVVPLTNVHGLRQEVVEQHSVTVTTAHAFLMHMPWERLF